MIAMRDLIERFGPSYMARYASRALPSQLKALAAMGQCRSSLSPQMLAQCSACDAQRLVPHSCGHRNCPHCQHHESQRWIERQRQALVPGNYFLITFTIPGELRELAWRHQRTVYARMMDCAWQTLRTFVLNHRQLQGSAGALALLHTHSRRLDFHPHVHVAMPAGALDADKRLWRSLRSSNKGAGYLFNHKALAKVFAAKLLQALREEGLALPATLPTKWVVDCRCVGSGESVLVYLGRYLYRGVIQERDIVRSDQTHVTYRWRDGATKKMVQRTVRGEVFLWLVLQHVLPKGLRRSRCYGYLHPNSKRMLALLQLLVFKRVPRAPAAPAATTATTARPQLLCICCGAPMLIVRRRILPSAIPDLLDKPRGKSTT